MAVTIYHNPRCSKSRETLALLEGKGLTLQVVEYLKTPPSPAELKRVLKALGMSAREVVRKKEANDAKIDAEAMTESDLIAAMVKHPEIIERPIVVNGEKAAIGRPPAGALEVL